MGVTSCVCGGRGDGDDVREEVRGEDEGKDSSIEAVRRTAADIAEELPLPEVKEGKEEEGSIPTSIRSSVIRL
jgi:hypothetical protein